MSTDRITPLESLPPEAVSAVKTKKLSGKKRLSQWLVLLKVLSQFDETVDDVHKKLKGRSIGTLVGTFVSMFISIFAIAFTEGHAVVIAVCGIVVLAFIVMAVIYGIKSSSLKKINLDNDFRKTLLPVLEILSEDIPPKGKIKLDLNLDDPSNKQYKISEKKLPPGKNRKLIERIYQLKSCSAEIPLVNGTVLILDVIKNPASYDRYYRNPRGKYKHKQKWKLLTTVTTSLLPAKEEFNVNEPDLSTLSAKEKIKLSEKKGVQLCKLSRKFKFKSADGVPEKHVPPDTIIDMFMKLCSMLNPAEQGRA